MAGAAGLANDAFVLRDSGDQFYTMVCAGRFARQADPGSMVAETAVTSIRHLPNIVASPASNHPRPGKSNNVGAQNPTNRPTTLPHGPNVSKLSGKLPARTEILPTHEAYRVGLSSIRRKSIPPSSGSSACPVTAFRKLKVASNHAGESFNE